MRQIHLMAWFTIADTVQLAVLLVPLLVLSYQTYLAVLLVRRVKCSPDKVESAVSQPPVSAPSATLRWLSTIALVLEGLFIIWCIVWSFLGRGHTIMPAVALVLMSISAVVALLRPLDLSKPATSAAFRLGLALLASSLASMLQQRLVYLAASSESQLPQVHETLWRLGFAVGTYIAACVFLWASAREKQDPEITVDISEWLAFATPFAAAGLLGFLSGFTASPSEKVWGWVTRFVLLSFALSLGQLWPAAKIRATRLNRIRVFRAGPTLIICVIVLIIGLNLLTGRSGDFPIAEAAIGIYLAACAVYALLAFFDWWKRQDSPKSVYRK